MGAHSETRSEAMRVLWRDPAYRARQLPKHIARCLNNAADPAARAKMSAKRKAAWADPDKRARFAAAIRAGIARSPHRLVKRHQGAAP